MFAGIRDWLIDYGYEVSQQTTGGRKVWVVSWENAK
jgi:hypothetical protein